MSGDDTERAKIKITRPRYPEDYPRTDLLDLLDELRSAPLIMVSGLPGAGKGALVAGYAETRNIPCLWYQVDHGDQDPATFFHYLSLAAREVNPFKKSHLPLPTPECIDGVSAAISDYFRKLYLCLDPPFLLVFNNFQKVSDSAVMRGLIGAACAILPPGGRIVLISSNDCPPTVACLRANRSTAIVGWQELQLYPARVKEIAALHGLALPLQDTVRQLQRRVGAWAAELILALQWPRDG